MREAFSIVLAKHTLGAAVAKELKEKLMAAVANELEEDGNHETKQQPLGW